MQKRQYIIMIGTMLAFLSFYGCASHRLSTLNSQLSTVNSQMWLKKTAADKVSYVVDTERMEKYRHIADSLNIIPVLSVTTSDPDFDVYHSLYHHGIAFETEQMAYRIYFDKKQTIDLYAKRTPRLELEQSLWYPNDEQLADGFGDDVLRVSGAIGVGAVKPWDGKKMVHIEKWNNRTQRIVERSADRTIQEIEVLGWQTEGKSVDMIVRYTMYAGHRDVEVEVFLSEPLENLVTGVQRIPLKSTPETTDTADIRCSRELIENDLLGSWGMDWPVEDTVKYHKEIVGLGVYVPQQYVQDNVQDKRNLMLRFKPLKYIKFYITAVALKENNPPANNQHEFFDYLYGWRDGLKKEF